MTDDPTRSATPPRAQADESARPTATDRVEAERQGASLPRPPAPPARGGLFHKRADAIGPAPVFFAVALGIAFGLSVGLLLGQPIIGVVFGALLGALYGFIRHFGGAGR